MSYVLAMSTEPNIHPIVEMSDVFGLFKNTELAEALKVGPSTVSEMKRRGNIPPEYWQDLIPAAHAKGRDDVTLEKMVELAARRSKRGVAA
ncbi:HTH-type transcriptional regulator protein [Rhizobium phage RHph_I3_18]|nr:HTH-type transcriptional regulator protein [Rhizobium phage RHph_I3_18]